MTIEELKDRKRSSGYTNREIADMTGIPFGTVQKIFSGGTRSPRRSTLVKLEQFFSEVDAGSYFDRNTEKNSSDIVSDVELAYASSCNSISGSDYDRQGAYSISDYYAIRENKRIELIDGVIYDMGTPSLDHQDIVFQIGFQLEQCSRKHDMCKLFLSPVSVQLNKDSKTMVEPDLVLLCDKSLMTRSCIFGAPDFVKRMAGTLREVLFNYINIVIALSFIAITVRGIQGDLAMLLYCIPSGMGRALGTINGVYYRAKDRKALERLYAYGLKLSVGVSVIIGTLVFITAPLLTRLYTHDPQFIALTIFSIRWMAVGLVFDTSIVLHQGYLQSTGSGKASTALIIGERLFLPVAFAFVLGMLFGTKGVLAALAVSRRTGVRIFCARRSLNTARPSFFGIMISRMIIS